MNRDGRRVTQDYYGRLLELMELPPREEHPPLAGFDLLETRWREFADWLAVDQDARRGVLMLPTRPTQRHVGLPISQTIFRRRDRVLLGRFFLRNQANIEAGWDILRMLRFSGSRYDLTQHARESINNEPYVRLARGALRAAYAAWDGSFEDDAGSRSWPGRLRLAATPRRIGLYLSSEHFAYGSPLEGPDGPMELRAYPYELEVPLTWLDSLAAARLCLRVPGTSEAIALPSGDTLLFEPREEGLLNIHAARDEPVWLLTRELAFQAPEFDEGRHCGALLPRGWTLLAAIEPTRLPAGLREREREGCADIVLRGGLRLGECVYLEGFAPALVAGELEEPVEVAVNGEFRGLLESFGRFELGSLECGTYAIDVRVTRFEIEIARRGRREGVGVLRWDLGDPPLFRNGAVRRGRAGRLGVGPFVCGSKLAEVERPGRHRTVMLRTNAPVFIVYSDGEVRGCSRPQPQGWQRQVGLVDGAPRWSIPDGERAEWVAVASRHPRVLRIGTGLVEQTAEVAEITSRYAEAPVERLHGSASQAAAEWRALCCACEEAYGPD
jgi:hypothetical protein